jgi:LmbE family N-acetylglucosaminyl deacetylase
MSVLIVTSHPDDEVLGCGGMAAALSSQGVAIHSCILASGAGARGGRPDSADLLRHLDTAHRMLGIAAYTLGDFPNIQMNTIPHLTVVQFIESVIVKTGADLIYTHHPHDLNDDHRQTSLACQAAARFSQRGGDAPPLRGLYYMEVPSSTDWSFPLAGSSFQPDTFFEIGDAHLETKLAALAAYKDVMRPFPHPRSDEVIRGLAACRGGQSGMRYAEAFQTAFHTLRGTDFLE